MAGARQAILERGLAKVTARDIAGAAGVSLAAIGYHFGTKDRLVAEAIAESTGTEIGDGMRGAILDAGKGRSLAQSLEATWNGMLDVIQNHPDELILSFENGVRTARSPESQADYVRGHRRGLRGHGRPFARSASGAAGRRCSRGGQGVFALFQGMALQWLIAPAAEHLMGEDVVRAVRAMSRE